MRHARPLVDRWFRPHAAVRILAVLAGALVVALAARVEVPLPGGVVPVSLQTFAVLVVGGVLGPGRGAAALLLYVALGAAGLPVLAEGAAGWDRVVGPSLGYLAGFIVAAWLVGYTVGPLERLRGLVRALGVATAAHAFILAFGAFWLAVGLGVPAADTWGAGVAPFLWGGLAKSVAAAAVLWLAAAVTG